MQDAPKVKPFNNWPNDYGFEVFHEEKVPVELKVSGNIPRYAMGTLYRTGPGGDRVEAENGKTVKLSHWFDGFSQVHCFTITPSETNDPSSAPKVVYNSRRIVDHLVEDIRKSGKFQGISFGQKRDPCETLFRKVMSFFFPEKVMKDPDHNNVGVTISRDPPVLTGQGQRSLFTATDNAMYASLDPDTLEPLGFTNQTRIHPDLVGTLSAAHPCTDPETGDLFNYNLDMGAKGHKYRIFKASAATNKAEVIATLTDAPGTYLHSFSITENFIVLCVWSGQYAWRGAKILWEANLVDAISDFDPKRPAKWYVIDRRSGKGVVATYKSHPFFCFHTVNSWEEPSPSDPSETDIIVDLCVYDNLDMLKRMYYNNLKSTSVSALEYTIDKRPSTRSSFTRFRLPDIHATSPSSPRQAIVDFTASKEKSGDLPTFNYRFKTKPSRFIYGVTDRGHSTFFDGLVKYDTQTHEVKYWLYQGQNPGEAIFVADPEGKEEDDGVLLSVVLDGFKEKSYLLVLDAKRFEEVGRAEMENAVGFGFHGAHYHD